jgi:acetyl esterase/lipase/short-subunit dehydrogenase
MPLDPRVRFMLFAAEKLGRTFHPDVSVEALRATYVETNLRYGMKMPKGVSVTPLTIPASDGATIGARLYRPAAAGDATLPVLMYFHGGGWVIGDVAGYEGFTGWLAAQGKLAVLSVDYRLGPEHPFPRFFEDSFDAFAWLQKNAGSLKVDATKIAVGGDSAGGGISAAIASYAESRGLRPPAFAWLIYPSVDGTGRFPSRSMYGGNLPLTPETVAWFKAHCTTSPEEAKHPLFVPLDAPNPERHCPTYISVAQYDPLIDEGRAYFERLRNAGVPVAYDLRRTLPHAFVNLAAFIPEAQSALRAGIDAVAIALGTRSKRVAAITGAGSGIGRALAIELANHNYALAISDRNEAGLKETAQMVADRTTVTTHVLDVSKKDEVDAFAAAVLREHGRADVIINNAGVSIAGDVAELSIEEIEWLMDINFWGTVYGVKAFLPALQRSGDGTIVNLSSVFGLVGPPGQSAYAASKFAVRGFSESLREELRGTGVHVVTVHPGGIKTNIAKTSRIAAAADRDRTLRKVEAFDRKMLTQTPEKAARLIVEGILKHKDRVLIGADAVQLDTLARVLGPGAAKLFGKMAARSLDAAPAPSAPLHEPVPVNQGVSS